MPETNVIVAYLHYYRKAIAAAIGVALLLLLRWLNIDLPGLPVIVVDAIRVALDLGAAGGTVAVVAQLPNGPHPKEK